MVLTLRKQKHQMCLVYRVLLRVAIFIILINGLAIYYYVSRHYNQKKDLNHHNKIDENYKTYTLNQDSHVKRKSVHSKKNADDIVNQPLLLKSNLHYAVNTFHSRTLLSNSSEQSLGDYPRDIFTKEEKKSGYIVLHVLGVCYMFLGLAIICDEFFVPALHIISRMLKISDDVAGATFMAAGGSAPELFTSVIGVFFTTSNVGFGTIVGSAVFNVLFVIGMCAIFSKVLLHLTWWPLLRDSLFYMLALIVLIISFYDKEIEWWEALIMFSIYIAYVIFMTFNSRVERFVKTYIFQRSKSSSSITPIEDKQQDFLALSASFAKNAFRHGAVQLVIHTLDPIAEIPLENKFEKIKTQCDTSLKDKTSPRQSLLSLTETNLKGETEVNTDDVCDLDTASVDTPNNNDYCFERPNQNGSLNHVEEVAANAEQKQQTQQDTITNANEIIKELDAIKNNNFHTQNHTTETPFYRHNSLPNHVRPSLANLRHSEHQNTLNDTTEHTKNKHCENEKVSSTISLRDPVRFSTRRLSRTSSSRGSCRSHRGLTPVKSFDIEDPQNPDDPMHTGEEEEGPIDLSWPDTWLDRIFYVIKLPLLLVLLLTVPDVRRPKLWRLFPLTFILSIIWIGGFTYLMVWWTAEIGDVAGIDIDTMGLTFLAAGTSIPDLITSVVVARQGLGDMAVSSSIGSNIFDVTVGLPVPWLIYSIYKGFETVKVQSDGLFCSTILLFIMLIAVVITIAVSKWKMTKILGLTMFLLYVIFIALTLLMQLDVLPCIFG